MPRRRKKSHVSSLIDHENTCQTSRSSIRRPSIRAKPREKRKRRAPAAFSPTSDAAPLRKSRKPKDISPEVDLHPSSALFRPDHKRLENKIKSQAHRLRYPLAFVEAYEAEGWRKSSREKLRPNMELEMEHRKIAKGKRALINGLQELKALSANEPQVPPQAFFEDVHCSRCGSTDIEVDNDILLCDSPGCHRAYHQRCQTPLILTASIPAGDELWFCEVCLAVFECLKSINMVFGTTYESVDDLFPELALWEQQQAATDARSAAYSGEGTALVHEGDDEEEDEDFVDDGGDADEEDDGDESDEESMEEVAGSKEEMAEEVLESAQDLLFLSKDDVIDLNHRSSRSKSASRVSNPSRKKPCLVGKQAAKNDRKSGNVILGVVAELEPPVKGRYSRWRIDYHDGSSELLTYTKTQTAINHAAGNDSGDNQDGDGPEEHSMSIVRSKRKRNNVDYRQLNKLMFAGRDEDSEDDEAFEDKEGSDDEPDEEENNEEEGKHDELKSAGSVSDQSSPCTVTASHSGTSELMDVKRNHRRLASVN